MDLFIRGLSSLLPVCHHSLPHAETSWDEVSYHKVFSSLNFSLTCKWWLIVELFGLLFCLYLMYLTFRCNQQGKLKCKRFFRHVLVMVLVRVKRHHILPLFSIAAWLTSTILWCTKDYREGLSFLSARWYYSANVRMAFFDGQMTLWSIFHCVTCNVARMKAVDPQLRNCN